MFRLRSFRPRIGHSIEAPGPAVAARDAATRPPPSAAQRAGSSRWSEWLAASGWRVSRADFVSSFGQRGRFDALGAARLDFAEALCDIHSAAAGAALDRIAVARSLHELWHLRGEVFELVSLRRDQAEAERRLRDLDRHFMKRSPPARWRDPLGAGSRDR